MAVKVLLARPNDFIVDDMRAWISALGVEPVRLSTLAELALQPHEGLAGVIISAAVTSSVPASPGAVFEAVRKQFRSTPVMIAGMTSLGSARSGLAGAFPGAELHGADEKVAWGSLKVLLYVPADQLRSRAPALMEAARAHLRLPS